MKIEILSSWIALMMITGHVSLFDRERDVANYKDSIYA